jgi:hypothetical protein
LKELSGCRFEKNELQMKKINDNNVEKIIHKGDTLYFVPKDAP